MKLSLSQFTSTIPLVDDRLGGTARQTFVVGAQGVELIEATPAGVVVVIDTPHRAGEQLATFLLGSNGFGRVQLAAEDAKKQAEAVKVAKASRTVRKEVQQ